MSRRNKLKKFADILSFPNVYENFDYDNPELRGKDGVLVNLKGKWKEAHFENNHPITLELACGRGEYTLGLARSYAERNFIGVDIKGARIYQGSKTALEEQLVNAAFLRTQIAQIDLFLAPDEVDEIWITFPDPFLRESKSNNRLTSLAFLPIYKKILKKGGLIHLKTDSTELYEFTLETLAEQSDYDLLYHDNDIYSKELIMPELAFKTYYENMHLKKGKTIKYVRMQLK